MFFTPHEEVNRKILHLLKMLMKLFGGGIVRMSVDISTIEFIMFIRHALVSSS